MLPNPPNAWPLCLSVVALCLAHASAVALPFGATNDDTSLYALGHYVHNVVFLQDDRPRDPDDILHPEDADGTVIHFTPDELAAQRQHILDAADFWMTESAARVRADVSLNITVNFVNAGQPFTVPDAGTPMGIDADTGGYPDALAFIDPVYAAGGATQATRRFNRDTRDAFGADWAWTTFVRPFEPRTASARLNGPNVNAYLDSNTFVHAHEAAHIFGALDHDAPARTDASGGYLDIPNAGAELLPNGDPNPDFEPSLMSRFNFFNFVPDTLDQLGWRDTDGDTLPDILDTFPRLFSAFPDEDPFANVNVDLAAGTIDTTLTGVVTPLASPRTFVSDATLNTLADLQYRLDRGAWVDLLPDDGTLGDAFDNYTLSLTGLDALTADGGLLLDLRLTNSVGNTSYFAKQYGVPEPAVASLLLTLGLMRRRHRAAG